MCQKVEGTTHSTHIRLSFSLFSIVGLASMNIRVSPNVIDSTSIYVFYLQLGVVGGVVDLVHVGVLPYVGHQVGV